MISLHIEKYTGKYNKNGTLIVKGENVKSMFN